MTMDTLTMLHRAVEVLYDLELSCRSTKTSSVEDVKRVVIVTEEVHRALMAVLTVIERLRNDGDRFSAPTDKE